MTWRDLQFLTAAVDTKADAAKQTAEGDDKANNAGGNDSFRGHRLDIDVVRLLIEVYSDTTSHYMMIWSTAPGGIFIRLPGRDVHRRGVSSCCLLVGNDLWFFILMLFLQVSR